MTAERQRSARRLFHWVGAVTARRRFASSMGARSAANRVLPGLRRAAHSLEACMRELGSSAPSRSVDARRLCAASFSAGRLVGYMEALEATDARMAQTLAAELQGTIESVEHVRRRFEGSA